MGNFLTAIRNGQCNKDDLFSYSTSRKVLIRDGYLGFFYFFCILIVIAYVGVYQIILNQQYRELADVASSHRVQLLNPVQRDNETNIEYCLNHNDLKVGHEDKDILTMPKQCRYWDEHNVLYPEAVSGMVGLVTVYFGRLEQNYSHLFAGELFVTTNVFEENQTLGKDTCFDPNDRYTCSYETRANTTFYPAETEWFRVRVS